MNKEATVSERQA